jgi:hypothetical protein
VPDRDLGTAPSQTTLEVYQTGDVTSDKGVGAGGQNLIQFFVHDRGRYCGHFYGEQTAESATLTITFKINPIYLSKQSVCGHIQPKTSEPVA